jgi:RNA polymerase sigma factor (TIGR02999 family)
MGQTHEITQMLHDWSDGKPEALEELLPVVYSELHRQAARFMRHERPEHTLQTTALIHEAYIKLVGQRRPNWKNRTHFFAISATLMRRILVDHARAQARQRRGGDLVKLPLDEAINGICCKKNIDLLALDEALERLAKTDHRQARVVELRFFGGLSLEETAAAMGVSRTTVADNWAMAKAWLHRELTR